MHLVDITMFYAAQGGGVSTYLAAKAHWLAQRSRISHTIVAPARSGGAAHDPPNAHFVQMPSLAIPGSPSYRMPRSPGAAAAVLRRLQPDLIEAGDPYQSAWAALRIKRETGIPVVAFYHSDLPQLVGQRLGASAQALATRYLQQLYRQVDLVLAPSEVMARRLRAMGLRRVRRQPLGVDTGVFTPQRRDQQLRARLGLAPDARLLVYAGRFTREKKLPLLIAAVEKLGRPYHLLLVGGGERLPHSPHYTCLPFQDGPARLAHILASCDLLVHAGDCETFGLVVLEAMACGLPVLGVAAGGVRELVDANTGLLVPPNDAAALADGVATLFARELPALGANARRKMVEQYDWDIIVPQLIARYAGLLASPQRAELEAGAAYATE
ncbi:MAG: glycosyltransferase family 1 protein [Burkholderiaceae bacterium]